MVDGNLPLVINDEVHLEFDFSYQGKNHLEDITFNKGQTLGIIGATVVVKQ